MADNQALNARQQMVVAIRQLASEGYDDKLAGHVSMRDREDGTILVPRVGSLWEEFTVDDIVRIDAEGHIVEGEGNLNPTIVFHLELHKARPDIVCALHNHPPYGTMWACAGELPPLYDQTGANSGGTATVYAARRPSLLRRTAQPTWPSLSATAPSSRPRASRLRCCGRSASNTAAVRHGRSERSVCPACRFPSTMQRASHRRPMSMPTCCSSRMPAGSVGPIPARCSARSASPRHRFSRVLKVGSVLAFDGDVRPETYRAAPTKAIVSTLLTVRRRRPTR